MTTWAGRKGYQPWNFDGSSPGPLGRANSYKKGYLKNFEQVGELSRSCGRILTSERYNKRALWWQQVSLSRNQGSAVAAQVNKHHSSRTGQHGDWPKFYLRPTLTCRRVSRGNICMMWRLLFTWHLVLAVRNAFWKKAMQNLILIQRQDSIEA